MSKLRCGVVILSLSLIGPANAVISGLPGRTDSTATAVAHAGAAQVNENLARIDGNISTVVNQVNTNEKSIDEIKTDMNTVKQQATDAVNSAAKAAESAAQSAITVTNVQTQVNDVQKTVDNVQGTVNRVVDNVDTALSNSKDAVGKANTATATVNTVKSDIEQYKKATTDGVTKYQNETTGRVTQFENNVNTNMKAYQQKTNETVQNIHNEVGEVKESIQGAIHDSATALIQSGDAKRVAEAANTTSQRVEAGLAQEIVDRKADVERGVSEANAYTDSRVKDFSNQLSEVKKFAAAGTAAALAASQVPQVSQGSAFSLGLGVGSYSGESALAIGMSARLGDYTVTKMAVTSDTSNNIGMGAGIAVEW